MQEEEEEEGQQLEQPRGEFESYFKIEPEVLSNLVSKIVKDCLDVKKGENIAIETWNHGLEVAKEFAFQVKKAGAHPLLLLEDESNFWRATKEIPPEKLGKVGKHEWAMLDNIDAYIFIPGPEDQERADSLSEDMEDAIFRYNDEWYDRVGKNRIRGLRIGLGYMNKARAKRLGLDFDEWVKEEINAYDLDYDQIEKVGKRLAKIMKNGSKVKITHPNGTDLRFRLKQALKTPVVDVGVMKNQFNPKKVHRYSVLTNLPSGSVMTVPREDSAKGSVKFNLPTPSEKDYTHEVSLSFEKDGLVSKYAGGENFKRNFKDKFDKEKKEDKGRLALFSIGVNPKQRVGFGYDDSAEGVVLLGIGHFSYGDKNKTGFRFYGLLEGSTVTIDGETIVENGKLII
jgi:leucyl aminopeptidase (aminopeptidase T)